MKRIKYINIVSSENNPIDIRYIRSKREWNAALVCINMMSRHIDKIMYNFEDEHRVPQLLGVNLILGNKNSTMNEKHVAESFLYNMDKRFELDTDFDDNKNFVYIRIPLKHIKAADHGLDMTFKEIAEMFHSQTFYDDEMYRVVNYNSYTIEAIMYINPCRLTEIKLNLVKCLNDFYRYRGANEMEALASIETHIGVFQ